MAAGMINISVTQLQFLPNQLLRVVFNKRISTIEIRDQGNSKNHEALSKRRRVDIQISLGFNEKIKRNSQVGKFISSGSNISLLIVL
jgi:hypothetical protein